MARDLDDPDWAARIAAHRERRPRHWQTVEYPYLVQLLGEFDDGVPVLVLVTPEVGMGVIPATTYGRLFRDEIGALNAALAAECGEVLLVAAGIPLKPKGP